MKYASDSFKIGDRVRMTREAYLQFVYKNKRATQTTLGTVVGYGNAPHCIRVRRDGTKDPYTFSVRFWKHLTPDYKCPLAKVKQ